MLTSHTELLKRSKMQFIDLSVYRSRKCTKAGYNVQEFYFSVP